MGMFDTIRCEYPLPENSFQEESFQTKSLECLLDEYTITKRGRLILHMHRHYQTKTKDVDVEYHGDLRFYTSVGERDEGTYEWVEYKARFTEGKVQWIKRVERE
jgi:hypothetical protein